METTPISNVPQPQQGEGSNQFITSDDNEMTKQILATHADHSYHKVDVRPHLLLNEEILRHSTTLKGTDIHDPQVCLNMKILDEKIQKVDFMGMLEALAYTIHKISCQISRTCSFGGGDVHLTTVAILKSLSKFSWNVKVVVALSAFIITYGEFWLVVELYETHPLAKSIAQLKQLPNMFERWDMLKPRFGALWGLFKMMLDMAKGIVQFHEMPTQYISPNQSPMSKATNLIPTAVYWTIRSIVACASQIIDLIGLNPDQSKQSSTTEIDELYKEVSNVYKGLTKQLHICNQYIEEKKQVEDYVNLVQLFETTHADNTKILKAIIYNKEELEPLYHGFTRKRVGVEVLRGSYVLLLISNLDISQEELVILENNMPPAINRYLTLGRNLVWLPMVDSSLPWTIAKQRDFERLQSTMSWYMVHHPTSIDPAMIRYIRKMWHFNKKPILVSLDPQGKVLNPNALHMMWIWGFIAHPFTREIEENYSEPDVLGIIGLLIFRGFQSFGQKIREDIFTWIYENKKFIFLYGGEDIDWIREFTRTAREVAKAVGIPFEMMYVGKRNSNKERVRRNIEIITTEKLSYCWKDLILIWYFWTRLESIWHYKMQHGKTIENDLIMKEIMTMLVFDSSNEQGWAFIGQGMKNETAKAKGDMILNCFKDYDRYWKENVKDKGFIQALNDHLQQQRTPHHCNRLIFPEETDEMIPEMLVCNECGLPMKKSVSVSVTYSCCID